MLMRDTTPEPIEKYIQDSLDTPSLGHSVYNNLAKGAQSFPVFVGDVQQAMGEPPQAQSMRTFRDVVDKENELPGQNVIGQAGINSIANMVGGLVNPAAWVFGAIGSIGMKAGGLALSAGAERVLPTAMTSVMKRPLAEMVGETLAKFVPKAKMVAGVETQTTLGTVAQHVATGFGGVKGWAVPDAIIDNFNNDTGHLNWLGATKQVLGNNGMDFGMALLPIGLGALGARIRSSIGKSPHIPIHEEDSAEALRSGGITQEEHDLFNDINNLKPENIEENRKIKQRATDYLINNGYKVDTADDTVPFSMLGSHSMDSIVSGATDEILSDMPEEHKGALTQFVTNASVDNTRSDPKMINGLRGYVQYVEDRMTHKDEILAKQDAILDENLEKGLNKNEPLSQDNIFNAVKKIGRGKVSGLVIPDRVSKRLKQELDIHELKRKNKILFKKYKKSGDEKFANKMKENDNKIKDIESSREDLHSPKEELQHLRKELLKDGVSHDVLQSKNYHRLRDLADVWHNARTLLDRVHLEHEYNKQNAYKDIIKSIVNLSDSNAARISNHENVIAYAKKRMESKVYKKAEKSIEEETVNDELPRVRSAINAKEQVKSVPADAENILNESEARVKERGIKELSEEFDSARGKYEEFKKSGGILNNFISCILGAANG